MKPFNKIMISCYTEVRIRVKWRSKMIIKTIRNSEADFMELLLLADELEDDREIYLYRRTILPYMMTT